MGIFATLVRRGAQAEESAYTDQAEGVADVLSVRFEAVGERLADRHDVANACAEVGRDTARDGVDLGAALDGLRTTYARVQGGEPDFRALRALCLAWSEETLGYLHQLSCEDPLTGLASLAHLRAKLSEVYRAAEQGGTSASTSHALVVVDLPLLARTSVDEAPFESAMRMVQLTESARLAFPGGETIGQATPDRLVVITRRGEMLPRRVELLRHLVGDLNPVSGRSRVWVEGLPSTDDGAAFLLDELARPRT